ncbi:hypothetical protein [Citricoccus sp. NR2]|uniref:hypothetical protein n=1 Tax=Citricoccus sp. NR2 TaxID=3004095 RepID=UPI0022DDCD0C|nr:hypothetical protein [Citricoccus sp. NR2]WBL18766.1 hypothetical protein O1A05_13570 [Citricoccus sp. NR2]
MNDDHQINHSQQTPLWEETMSGYDAPVQYVMASKPKWRTRVRGWFSTKKNSWAAHTIDAPLPERVENRLPSWARTVSGRVLVGAAAVAVILGWGVVAVTLVS